MSFRIVNPDLRRQKFCDLCSAHIRMDIIDLVSDGPHDHAWVDPVAADPGRNVLPVPLLEKPGVIIFCLRPFPHVKCLINNENAHFVTQIKKLRGGRIMARSDSVHAHSLHQIQLASRSFFVKRRAKCA